MKNNQKGFILPIIIVVAILVIGGGIYFFSKKPQSQQTNNVEVNSLPTPVTSTEITTTPAVEETKTTVQVPATVPPKQTAPTTSNKITPPAPIVKKNIYTNTAAGYSLELPENWIATPKANYSDPNEPEITGTYLSVKNKTADEQGFTFDIDTSTTKTRIDYYKQEYSKTPTYDDLFNIFIETQKSTWDEFVLTGTRKTTINGNEAYEATSLFSGGGGTQKFYVFYTSKNTYVIMIQGLTDTWKDHEAELLSVVGTFKIQ